jgi:hypothetical protein
MALRCAMRSSSLKVPHLEGDNLTFDVRLLEGDLGAADGPASVFVDIIGLPFTPPSVAGVARRGARPGTGPPPQRLRRITTRPTAIHRPIPILTPLPIEMSNRDMA